jgi:heme A synthase
VGFIGVLILGMSGALTALGDTLFPVSSLEEGLRQDFSSAAHFLIRLRILHPTIAILASAYLFIVINWVFVKEKRRDNIILGRIIIVLLIMQLLAGFINVILLAPVWMQLIHLLLSDLVWISLVLFAAASLSQENVDLYGDPI